MRPAANFTIHAILAACLAALAASSAAAAKPQQQQGGKEQAYFTITLQDAHAAGGKGEQLEIQSYSWGPRQSTSTDGSLHKVHHNNESDASAGKGASNEMRMEDSAGAASGPKSPGPGAITVRGNFPGCAVGKRYAGMQFGGGGMQYQLEDLVVAECAVGGATLNYAKVKVRGWDPSKKEE